MGADVALLVTGLISATDDDGVYRRMEQIESRVAPVSGGLGPEVGAVVAAVISGLPRMTPPARSVALDLLAEIAHSLELFADTPGAGEAAANLVAALPFIAGLVESGDDASQSGFVDLISLCVALDPRIGERVLYYLSRLASEGSDGVAASARTEIEEVRRLLA